MKKLFTALLGILLTIFSLFLPTQAHAQNYKPAVVLTPSGNVNVGENKVVQLSLVNMGIALRRIEITVQFSGDMDRKIGYSFDPQPTEQYGLAYKSHYFTDFPGRPDTQRMIVVFEATQPQGYNQGSSQIPLVNVTYKAVAGVLAASIDAVKITDAQGNLLPSVDTFGASNYRAEEMTSGANNDLSIYSLSFESDPVRKWWPTAADSVQQVLVAIWKDGDGNNVKTFSNLGVEWQVDSNYMEINNTSSAYFDRCVLERVGNRPCILLSAHVMTKRTGTTAISVRITDNKTGKQVWNSAPLEIYALDANPSSTPTMNTPTPLPSPSFIPEGQVSQKEFQDVQQKVTYLQSQLDEQKSKLSTTQGIVDKIVAFLKRLFRFK